MAVKPTFLYPNSRQFSFDEVCSQIVQELEIRNWQAPGMEVEFRVYGTGEQQYRLVQYIRGFDFKLSFGRIQRYLPGGEWNDTAGISEIVIPHKELHVYEDESGPTLYLYVGNDWERDRKSFMSGLKVNSKLRGEPKMYLEYKGGCDCQATAGASYGAIGLITATLSGDRRKIANLSHTHRGRRSPLLVHTNDLGREYDPEGDEPMMFRTEEVFAEFEQWLKENVLKPLLDLPIPSEKTEAFVEPPSIPLPDNFPPIFTIVEEEDSWRIKTGKQNVDRLKPGDRYGLLASGRRLVTLDVRTDGTVPEKAYDGFLWCGVGEVTVTSSEEELQIPGFYRWDAKTIVRIVPNRANDIYIADFAGQELFRNQYFAENPEERRMEGEAWQEINRIPGRTLVTIAEYDGSYTQPVILINRTLDFDELEIIGDLPNTRTW